MNEIDLKRYDTTDQKIWDNFVQSSLNGTIFHERRFISYHPANRFRDHSLIFLNSHKIVSVLPANLLQLGENKVLISHQGLSFGGFVYNKLSLKTTLKLVEKLVTHLKQEQINKIELTLPPVIYEEYFNNYFEFSLLKSGFVYAKQDLTSVIPLAKLKTDILNQFDNKARTNIRKGIREGVKTSFSNDLEIFYKILIDNFLQKHGNKPTHDLDDLKYLVNNYPQRIMIFGAFLADKMIAGSLVFVCNKTTLLTFYLALDTDYQDLRPLNVLIYKLSEWAIQNNFKYLDFGTITHGMDINPGLTTFKENFGGIGVFRKKLEYIIN